jgi:hypothetical protein
MVEPAENISRSYPAIAWQFMAMDAWARPRPAGGIRNAGSQARMGSSLIVVGNPLPQDRPKMLRAQRDHVIQGIHGASFPSPVHSKHWPAVPARRFVVQIMNQEFARDCSSRANSLSSSSCS